ncbi:MAG: ABC transporter ATP-binding protein [Acidobacteriota bacterium]
MVAAPSTHDLVVSVRGLSKTYQRLIALDAVGFSIRRGEMLGLIGPNGAGKTTLFECLAGVLPADGGTVVLHGGAARSARSETLFYLPDAITPWPDERVEWVLQFTLGFFGGRRNLYADVVERLGLAPMLPARIGTLSKGQRKRALLGVGLLTPQPLLLVDEPFEGLDLRQSREMAATLRWHVADGRTLFVSIHQIQDAGRLCDRFVLLTGGRVCAEGTAEELATQAAARAGARVPDDFAEVFLALT